MAELAHDLRRGFSHNVQINSGGPDGAADTPYRILLAEDEETLLHSTCILMQREGFECVCVSDATEALERLHENDYDVLVADYKMPGNEELQLLETTSLDFPDLPVIIITGYPSLNSAVKSLKHQAFDYVTKPLDMEYLFKRIAEAARLRRLNVSLRESEERYRIVADFTYDWEYWIAPDGSLVYVSPSCERVTGYPRADFMDNPELLSQMAHPADREKILQHLREELRPQQLGPFDFRIVTRRGEIRWIAHTCQPVYAADNQWIGQRASNRDITERKQAEVEKRRDDDRMKRFQKLESLATMAAGIAHDFNNILYAAQGNLELAAEDIPEGSETGRFIGEAAHAVARAVELSSQMLAYSGKGKSTSESIDLSELVTDTAQLLAASASRNVTIQYSIPDDLPAIKGDVSQIRQILMNLVLNASEAIGDEGGSINIGVHLLDATREDLDATYIDDNLPTGPYLCLEVADTGCGMDEEALSKIFDPFVTTKFQGRGLGLSATLGIIRGHQGAIEVTSQPARGTTFRVLLPALDVPVRHVSEKAIEETAEWTGTGTILFVDDEKMLRRMVKQKLQRMGFDVLTAADGKDAVEIFRQHMDHIACVILDLTMPRMGGREAFDELRRLKDDVPIILSSGYTEEDVAQRFGPEGLARFLRKPYRSTALIEKLREVLGA